MDRIPNTWILTDSAFESMPNSFAHQFNLHPPFNLACTTQTFRYGIGTHLRHNANQILVTLRNADETAHLSNLISLAINDR